MIAEVARGLGGLIVEAEQAGVFSYCVLHSDAELIGGLEVKPNVLHRWRREIRDVPGTVFPGNGILRWPEGRSRTGAQNRPAGADWISAVYRKVKEEMKTGRGLTVERMVQLGHISRASFTVETKMPLQGATPTWNCAIRFNGSR